MPPLDTCMYMCSISPWICLEPGRGGEGRGGEGRGGEGGGGGEGRGGGGGEGRGALTLIMSSKARADRVPIMTSPIAMPAASPITASSRVIRFSFRRSYASWGGERRGIVAGYSRSQPTWVQLRGVVRMEYHIRMHISYLYYNSAERGGLLTSPLHIPMTHT